MGLLWMMMMMMFLVHVEAEKMTEVKVKVGDNVTLTCSDNTSNMYWYVQIHGNIRGFIGRTFSGRQEPSYCSPSSMSKYQLREDTLVITNTTAEDCRLYTCAKKVNSVIVDMSTFHLVSDVPSLLSCNDSQTAQHWTTWLSDYVIYGSLTLNAVFILVTTGLVVALQCLKKKRKRKRKSCDTQIYENLHRPKCANKQTEHVLKF